MDSLLRDIDRSRSKMRADVDNLHRHQERLEEYISMYVEQSVIEWAALVASHPNAILLVIETTRIVDETGYYDPCSNESEPIRLTALSLANGEVWDQFIYTTFSSQVQGTEHHGIVIADLEGHPCFEELWPEIARKLEGQQVVIFGADWARKAIKSVHSTEMLDSAFCLHNKCKEYYSEFYDLSLEKVLGYQGINIKRDQLTDSRDRILILAQVLRNLAAGMEKIQPEERINEDLDEHPF